MRLDLPDDYVPLLITALEHRYAYTRAVRREDVRYQQAADWFKRQPTPSSDKPVRTVKRTVGVSRNSSKPPASPLGVTRGGLPSSVIRKRARG
jgi:hypothetical protein